MCEIQFGIFLDGEKHRRSQGVVQGTLIGRGNPEENSTEVENNGKSFETILPGKSLGNEYL